MEVRKVSTTHFFLQSRLPQGQPSQPPFSLILIEVGPAPVFCQRTKRLVPGNSQELFLFVFIYLFSSIEAWFFGSAGQREQGRGEQGHPSICISPSSLLSDCFSCSPVPVIWLESYIKDSICCMQENLHVNIVC